MAVTLCDDLISQDILASCSDPIVSGVEALGVIINRADIDFVLSTSEATRKNVITGIAFKTGKKGYGVYVPSNEPFAGTTTTLESGNVSNKFTSNVGFVVLNNDPDVTGNIIDKLANGEFVVVIENKYKNANKATTPGDSTYQIYGWQKGLRASTIENDKYSEDTDGGWNVVLTETATPKSAYWFFDGTSADTKTAFDALTADPA